MPKDVLSNMEVVLLAVYRLGGELSAQHTEDIAVEADKLAPGRFRWRKYPQFISDELIRVFLSDAKKEKNGALLAGDGSRGWRLTLAGARAASTLAGLPLDARQRTSKDIAKRQRIERQRLLDLSAWAKYFAGEPITLRDAEAVFRIGDYTKRNRRVEMINRLQLLFGDDEMISGFLSDMATVARTRED